MSQHVGIVACSAEGAALCYRTLCAEAGARFGPHGHPEVSLHGHALAMYMPFIEAGDWPGAARLMLSSAEKLARAGADFLICPDNTIHQALPWVLPASPLPWLNIAEAVAAEARRRGYARLALTGARWLVESKVYPQALAAVGLECVRPTKAERDEINAIIMDELVRGRFTERAVQAFQRIIGRLKSE
ncbi:MAG TPA: aspartate/glutamate racemase family protein, partial [Caulobacteraceae bacterium]